MSNNIVLSIALRSTVLFLLMTGNLIQGKAFASVDDDGNEVGASEQIKPVGDFAKTDGESFLRSYDDPSSIDEERTTNEMLNSEMNSPLWSGFGGSSGTTGSNYLNPGVHRMMYPIQSKRFGPEMANDIISLPRPLSLIENIPQTANAGQLNGFKIRPASYNLRGYSASGNGRRGFLPPMSPRKRQILFRQCFFNPISCF